MNGFKRTVTRREFVNGFALSLAAGTCLSPVEAVAQGLLVPAAIGSDYYPPRLTGLRGSHPGAFETAHAVAREGKRWPRPDQLTDGRYDLVVVGGGISGLSSAMLFRQRTGPDASILVLDNHDDFGGHAKRNEFEVDGRQLLCLGGSQNLESPGAYSRVSRTVIEDVGIDVDRLRACYDRSFSTRHGLRSAIFFDKENYGERRALLNPFNARNEQEVRSSIAGFPFDTRIRSEFERLFLDDSDYLAGHSANEKIRLLKNMSYDQFLERHAGMPKDVIGLVRQSRVGYWGLGFDRLAAWYAYEMEMPGTTSLFPDDEGERVDYGSSVYFPDGNAGTARLLVRKLLPDALPGNSMEDAVTARLDYTVLDRESSRTRIRLNSTAVDVRHSDDGRAVDVTYVSAGNAFRVRGRHVVLACYNGMIPHICPEVPAAQKAAINYASKVPLVYASIALRNWRAFAAQGFGSYYVPGARYFKSIGLHHPVSIGDYRFTDDPDRPIMLRATFIPVHPESGLNANGQHRLGRQQLYEMTFADFEESLTAQLDEMLGSDGFDAARDIAGITVNRWPHGYAYEYSDYEDPPEYGREVGPHVAGRARIGRISIANSDSSAYAYVDGAIDAAHRAVSEQLAVELS